MKMEVSVELNLKTEEVVEKVTEASRLAMRDTVVEVAHDSVELSPWKTGNNRRSIFFGASGFGHKQSSGEGRRSGDTWTGEDLSVLDDSKIEGAVYSTSGYGGFLETGTRKMAAQPYFRPSLDKNFTTEKFTKKVRGYLK